MTSSKKSADSEPDVYSKPVTDDAILKVTKEIVVKFIETGRLAPSNFDETFQNIFNTVKKTVRS
ncbi:MAG: hypothetical protein KAR13_10815 [Desulfobulbaceae bacterium]|nr:hypothetical protein [Desulfobulbaceae bacterium]MCK5437078.1 hypothetical protein [Desulfobulbaceae bacterium]